MTQGIQRYVLTASCPDVIGIVRSVTGFLYDIGAGVTDAAQFRDEYDRNFFMRLEFVSVDRPLPGAEEFSRQFGDIAAQYGMQWNLYDMEVKTRAVIAVSKYGHCLNDLLFRWEEGELSADIVAVVSNHDDLRAKVEWHGVPFYHLPVSNENRRAQEQQILSLMQDRKADLLVLARYMQILTPQMCADLVGRAINIHHSFLPSFKGAKPYHQAFERGVKIIGATAHYVTNDLDEGPIIEQDVQRVEHSHSIEEFVRKGRDVETQVLSRALEWHAQHRVLLNGGKTVIFK